MVYVRHKMGGSVAFVKNGIMTRMSQGQEGDIPKSVFDRHPDRFEKIEGPPAEAIMPPNRFVGRERAVPHHDPGPVPNQNTQMQQPPAQTRAAPEPGRYVARHRGFGKWHVYDTIENRAIGDSLSKDEAKAAAERMQNGEV